MGAILRLVSRAIGVVLMAAAFIQWVTYDYPDINPFWPGAIFVPGMLSQVLNWLIVCILATVGWGAFTVWQFKLVGRKADNLIVADTPEKIAQRHAKQTAEESKAEALTPSPAALSRPQNRFSLQQWQDFLREFDSTTTFNDYASTFLHSQSPKISPELKTKVDGFGDQVQTAVFAIKHGAVSGFWVDEFHNYFAIFMSKADGAPVDHMAIISLGKK